MALGRVNWFGGLNKKTGQVNNFGFLNAIDGAHQGSVYIGRRNVPSHIQPLLEPGTYVEFDICEDERGEKYATSIEMVLLVGTVIWFKNGRGYIRCEGYDDVRVESLNEYESNTIVSFYIRYSSRLRRNEALLPQIVEQSTEDKVLIGLCATSSQPEICVPFISRYAALLPEDTAVSFVKGRISSLNVEQQQSVLRSLVQYSEELLLISAELRQQIIADRSSMQSSSAYWQFIDSNVRTSNGAINQELLDEVILKLSLASEETRLMYWKQSNFLTHNLEYKGDLWDFAPIELKAIVVRQRYSGFFDLTSKFKDSKYAFSDSLSSAWKDLYRLDDIDDKLTNLWCSNSSQPSSAEKTRMISARGAEKLAIKFFRDMGHQVEDIAAYQADNRAMDIWKQADIQIDSKYLLDVKNARNAVNSKVYSEFCVPKFKQKSIHESNHSDVFIVAVLSPYLQGQYVINLSSPRHFTVTDPCVLGVFRAEQLKQLEEVFTDETLSIDLSRGLDPKKYLPPWLFDYSAQFYKEQNKIKHEFLQLEDSDIPDWTDLWLGGEFPIPLFISARRAVPMSWVEQLPTWQVNFIELLADIQSKTIFLPHLFLAILRHFLTMLTQEDSSYSPKRYISLIYAGYRHPLKLYDPLNIINDFCETLQCLWDNREKANLTRFKIFSFSGRGMLRGKQSHSHPWTTILAYCGGQIDGKGKCGYTPLVIGQHSNCDMCGYLVCPKKDCQHCSRGCTR